MCRSGLEHMRADAAHSLDLLDADSQWRSAALLLLAMSYLIAGEIGTAEEVLSEAQAMRREALRHYRFIED